MKLRTANVNKANSLAAGFAMQKSKIIVAACLIGLMVFMWVRVLTKKGGARNAQAASANAGVLNDQPKQQVKIRYVEPPVIKGRNDVLTRDFFTFDGWEKFTEDADGRSLNKAEEVSVVATDDGQPDRHRKDILRLVKQLTVDAIALGKVPVAFINDTLVSVGGKLHLKEKNKLYELDVIEISDNEVVLTCDGVRIEIKMLQPNEQYAPTDWTYGS